MEPLKIQFVVTKVGEEEIILLPASEWVVDNVNPEYCTLRRVKELGKPQQQVKVSKE